MTIKEQIEEILAPALNYDETRMIADQILSLTTSLLHTEREKARAEERERIVKMCEEMKYDANLGMCSEKDPVVDFVDLLNKLTNNV